MSLKFEKAALAGAFLCASSLFLQEAHANTNIDSSIPHETNTEEAGYYVSQFQEASQKDCLPIMIGCNWNSWSNNEDKEKYYDMDLKELLEHKSDPKEAYEIYEFYQERVVHLRGKVSNRNNADEVIARLKVLDELNPGKPIALKIDSYGGYVYDGLRIYHAIKGLDSPVHTICDGKAASMAAVLTIAGSKRIAEEGCHIMIHEVAGGARGKTSEIKIQLDHSESLQQTLYTIISEHSGLSISDIKRIASVDKYYNAEDSETLGFVDEVRKSKHAPDIAPGSRQVPPELFPSPDY